MIFFVDLENVASEGFQGLEELTCEDKLVVFYSAKSTITVNLHLKLHQAKSQQEYLQVQVGGKNALDFQLVTYLGALVEQNKDATYCIVSRDNGFRFVVDFWQARGVSMHTSSNIRNGIFKAAPPEEPDAPEEVPIPEELPAEVVAPVVTKAKPVAKPKPAPRPVRVQADQEITLEQVIQVLPEEEEETTGFILDAISKYKTKQGINNAIVKKYGSEEAGRFHKAIKPLIKYKKGH